MFPGDPYTALPPSSRSRRRVHSPAASSPSCLLRPEQTDTLTLSGRRDLLDRLIVSVTEDEEAMRHVHLLFGLHQELDSSPAQQSNSDLPPDSPVSVCSIPNIVDPWDLGIEILDKHHYLLTPIRTRIFPKASPGVLRNLLNTPSLRALTPEQSISPEDTSLLGSPLCHFKPHGNNRLSPLSAAPVEVATPSEIAVYGRSDADPHKASSFLPSPPPSTELPSLVSFPLPSTGPESPPAGSLDHRSAKRAEPFGDARRSSSQEHRWPFPELIPSGLRAAPCSPLLTTRAVGDESSPPLSSAAQGRGRRPTDPRKHAHPGLAFGVVRNFQRVLDELQGLGHESSHNANDATSMTGLHAPGLVNQINEGPPWKSERRTHMYGQEDSQGEQHVLATSSAARRHAYDSSTSCDGRLGPTEKTPAGQIEPTSASLDELDSEFLSLLLGKAAEEEACAAQLRAMADRLDRQCALDIAAHVCHCRPGMTMPYDTLTVLLVGAFASDARITLAGT
ncbi:hypothetical protein C8Q73DRAFT_695148 [Cubamyces lactineus]|nr:hypothetical protein C8Q73DRAFT_695148 [Cubamyces lactineus]